MDILAKAGEILERTKTPLALAGLVILVLYALYNKILGLNIFSNIGAEGTSKLIGQITDYVFWLAILAVVLGAGGYLLSYFSKSRT